MCPLYPLIPFFALSARQIRVFFEMRKYVSNLLRHLIKVLFYGSQSFIFFYRWITSLGNLLLSLLLLFKLIRSPKINIGRLNAIFSRIATGLSAFNKNTGVLAMLIFLHGKWALNRKVQGSKYKYNGFSVLQVKEEHGWGLSLVSDIKVSMIAAKLDDLEVGE